LGALPEEIYIGATALPDFLFAIILAIWLIVGLAVYSYISFAYSAIGKKAKLPHPNLAWIPFFGPLIISSQAAKMSLFPLLLILTPAIFFLELFTSSTLSAFLSIALVMISIGVFIIYTFIWKWKMYEAIKRPGWWALLKLVPSIGVIIDFILVGVAAWTETKPFKE
jgi:hypothetical protein